MTVSRQYSTRRLSLVESLVDEFKKIDGTGDFRVNLYKNVHPRLLFWDEVVDYPAVHVSAGSETRDYQGAGFKDRYLSVTIRCYVEDEDAVKALDYLLEDLETVIERCSRLPYFDKDGNLQYAHQLSIVSISTDEGVLSPIGVGEILLEVRY